MSEAHFYHPAHAVIYRILFDFLNEQKAVDFITLAQRLQDRGELDKVGGPAALSELFTFVPTASNVNYYLEILVEKYTLRQIITTCTELAARSYDEQGEVEALLGDAETKVLAIRKSRSDEIKEMKMHVMTAIVGLEALYNNRGGITGLPTGFAKLDQMTSGLHPGEMFVIAARPSMGKTALAMNIAEHVAVDAGKAVGIFSLEMSTQQLVQRLLCSRARVNLQRVRDGMLSQADISKVMKSAQLLSGSRMYIDDTAGLGIMELRAKARRMRQQHKIELVVVDYLQLLRSISKRAQENRQVEIAEISSGIKAMAKELKIPVVVLAQLNRKPEDRGGRPRLSDLRESGSIEQDADCVALLVRSEYYEDDDDARAEKAGEAELIIAKQRNGPTGEIPLSFLKEYTRFEDRAESREEKK